MNSANQNQLPQTVPAPNAEDPNTVTWKNLPRLLRSVGAITLIASISILLLQGWDSGNDAYRYLLLLGHSAALAIIGFASGHLLKESKGARLLLTIALASVPANFAILGAFLFSRWQAGSSAVPSYALWQVDSLGTAITMIAGALVVLVPLVYLGFMVLARSSARYLGTTFLVGNLALLIPLRDQSAMGVLMLALTATILLSNRRIAHADFSLRTWEGFIARLLQLVPVGVMFGRTVWLYSGDAFIFTAMAVITFVMLRQLSQSQPQQSRVRGLLESVAILPAVATGFGVAVCAEKIAPGLFRHLGLPVFAATTAALLFEIGARAAQGGKFRRSGAILMALGFLGQLWMFGGIATAAITLLCGLGLVIYGYAVEQRVVFSVGLVLLLTGLGYQISYAVVTFNLGSWGSLATLGIAAIVAGSALERHGSRIKTTAAAWTRRFRDWEY